MKTNNERSPDGKFKEGNQASLGNEGGRPPLFSNPEELKDKINEYFEYIEGEFIIERKITSKTTGKGKEAVTTTEDEPVKIWIRHPEAPSVTGLAFFLGFESRQSLYDYDKKAEYSYIIKRGLIQVEMKYEKGLWQERPTGAIFALKNMGWNDRTETDITTKGDKINNSPSLVRVEVIKPDFED